MIWNKGLHAPIFIFENVLTRCADRAMIRTYRMRHPRIRDKHRGTKAMKCKMSIQAKRDLLDSFAGRFYSIEWIKSNGELRSCTGRHLQHDMFAAGHASKAQASTVAHKPNLYTMVDVTNEKWVNVNLDKLRHVKCGSVDITFED